MLMRNWLKTWNLLDITDDAKQNLAKLLKAQGINDKSSTQEVVEVFKKVANEQLEANGLQNNKDLQVEVEIYAEVMIETNYEVLLRSFIVSSE